MLSWSPLTTPWDTTGFYVSGVIRLPSGRILMSTVGAFTPDSRAIIASDDGGVTWASKASPFDNGFCAAFAYDGSRLVAVGYSSDIFPGPATDMIAYSDDDGDTWTGAGNPFGGFPGAGQCVAWSTVDSVWVAGATNSAYGVIATSPDGAVWTPRTTPLDGDGGISGNGFVNALIYSTLVGKWVAVGQDHLNNGAAMYSTNAGATWTQASVGPFGLNGNSGGLAEDTGAGNLIAMGYTTDLSMTRSLSTDGDTWADGNTPFDGGQGSGIAAEAGYAVAVGTSGAIESLDGGVTWADDPSSAWAGGGSGASVVLLPGGGALSGGLNFASTTVADLGAPAAPTVPDAPTLDDAIAGNAQAQLDWTPGADGGSAITGYNVYRSLSSGTEVLVATLGVVTTYLDSPLTNGVTYFYKVTAVNAIGESALSNELSASPTVTPPDPPTLDSALAGDSEVVIHWTPNSSPVTAYNIYRGLSSGAEVLVATVGPLLRHYEDFPLTNGTTYFYEVTAVNAGGESGVSNELSATPARASTAPRFFEGYPWRFIFADIPTFPPPVLFGALGTTFTTSDLYRINAATGAATSVGPIGDAIAGLAEDPVTGVLYAATTAASTANPTCLLRIDRITGNGHLIGALGLTVTDIAFLPDGVLYGWEEGGGLCLIDTTTGAAAEIAPYAAPPGGLATAGDLFLWTAPCDESCNLSSVDQAGTVTDQGIITGYSGGDDTLLALATNPRSVNDVYGLAINTAGSPPTVDLVVVDVTSVAAPVNALVGATLDGMDAIAWASPSSPGGVTTTFAEGVVQNRQVVYTVDDSNVITGDVWSDQREVNELAVDGFPNIAQTKRIIYAFRREGGSPPWKIRAAGVCMIVEDGADDDPVTHLTAYDGWKVLEGRPCLKPDLSLPDSYGIPSFGLGLRGNEIVGMLLKNTIDSPEGGFCFIDAGTAYGGTTFYSGTIEDTPQVVLNFQQGTMVADAWKQVCEAGFCDIYLRPIYDPVNRPGYTHELNVYNLQGHDRYDAVFAWDKMNRSASGIDRLHDATPGNFADVVQYFVGQGGPPASIQINNAAVAAFGNYWSTQFFPNQTIPSGAVVTALAQQALRLSRQGKRTVTLNLTPERSPIPLVDYGLGDFVPVYATNRLRAPITSSFVPDPPAVFRVEAIPVTITDDGIEQVTALLLSPDFRDQFLNVLKADASEEDAYAGLALSSDHAEVWVTGTIGFKPGYVSYVEDVSPDGGTAVGAFDSTAFTDWITGRLNGFYVGYGPLLWVDSFGAGAGGTVTANAWQRYEFHYKNDGTNELYIDGDLAYTDSSGLFGDVRHVRIGLEFQAADPRAVVYFRGPLLVGTIRGGHNLRNIEDVSDLAAYDGTLGAMSTVERPF